MPQVINSKSPYLTASYPPDGREEATEAGTLLNGQHCTCGHDRLCHRNTVGAGAKRQFILNCPRAGACGVRGCACTGFRFDSKAQSDEGKKRRKLERAKYKVIPPEV